MNIKSKQILQNIGGALIGIAVISPIFFLPYPYGEFFMLAIYVAGTIYFYLGWKSDYYVSFKGLFKIALTVVILKSISIWLTYNKSAMYNWFGLDGLPHLVVSMTVSTATAVLIFYVLYLWIFTKNKWPDTWEKMTDAELLRYYVMCAKVWGEAQNFSIDETKKSDEMVDRVWTVYRLIKQRRKLEILLPLLKNKYDGVKLFAARCLLWTNEQEAMWALREVGARGNATAKLADELIDAWEAKEVLPDTETLEEAKNLLRPWLKGVRLKREMYKPSTPNWGHDSCEFCFAKFAEKEEVPDALHEGYASKDIPKRKDGYYWICENCFKEFRNTYKWKVD